MSVPVPLADLRAAIAARRSPAFLLTTADDGRPHAVAARPTLDGDGMLRVAAGGRTRTNAAARPLVSLVWPPDEPGDFNLIVDATATDASADAVVLEPTWAVLHRPARDPDAPVEPGTCGADCLPLTPRPAAG